MCVSSFAVYLFVLYLFVVYSPPRVYLAMSEYFPHVRNLVAPGVFVSECYCATISQTVRTILLLGDTGTLILPAGVPRGVFAE